MERETPRIVGRKEEQELLEKLYLSPRAEFLAVYGRRRVGKTYLIREFFKNKGIFFEITGAFDTRAKEQIHRFNLEYSAFFKKEEDLPELENWSEALHRLKNSVEALNGKQKIVLFFDELPWLCDDKSDFLSALDYIWNRHFSQMPHVLLIVAGSAASWMISHIVQDTGGLYGRLSAHLRLIPFSLYETEQYLLSRKIELPRKQICEIYMVTGGVPKYLSYLEPGLSSAQNIHNLCFKPQSPLLVEFHKLYHSLFRKAKTHLRIVRALATKRHGMTRSELLEKTSLSSSGKANTALQELEESGFITTLSEIGKKSRDKRYYLNDEYTLFYLTWIEPEKGALLQGAEDNFWIKRQALPSWKSWAGFAFESLCLKHVSQIKKGLQIGGVTTTSGYWKETLNKKKEVEIDLVINRADQCINLCEIKFHDKEFTVTKECAEDLERKKHLFADRTETRKALFVTLITPYGAKANQNYLTAVDKQLTLDVLFLSK